jgi:AraC-like DNA-binding protein
MDIPCNKWEILRMREELKLFPELDHEHMPFAMEVFGISYCDGTYEMIRSCAELTVIEYVISGTGTVETPHGIFHPKAGDSYLLRANEPHHYYSDKNDPWVKIWVNFQGQLIAPILDAYGLTHSTLFPELNTYDYLKRIHNIAGSDTLETDTMMDQCCRVFLELCQFIRQHSVNTGKQTHVPKNIALLKEYLDDHIGERLTLEKCGEITYLSVSQTIRSFRSAYGVTPYEYLNQRRINIAKLLLRNSTLSIEEIATQTGFPDHNYFSKYFKKKVGLSPTQFRKQQ